LLEVPTASERPAPPPSATIRTTPPPTLSMPSQGVEPQQPQRATFRVRVTGAEREIWSGDITLQGYQGAELALTLQEADSVCANTSESRFDSRRTGLAFSMSYAGRRDPEVMKISANWTRRSRDCTLPGTRSTGLETTVAIASGAVRIIEADGGLRIEITRTS
jgi:hypothetical protein